MGPGLLKRTLQPNSKHAWKRQSKNFHGNNVQCFDKKCAIHHCALQLLLIVVNQGWISIYFLFNYNFTLYPCSSI